MKTVQLTIIFLFLYTQAFTQNTYAVPFVTVNTNARSSSMGEITVVSNSLNQPYHLLQNPSLMVGRDPSFGISFGNYFGQDHPLDLRLIDINLFGAINKKNSLAMSFRIFNMGETIYTDINGGLLNAGAQKEFIFSLRYSRLVGKHFAIGAGFKYIQSDLFSGFQIAPGAVGQIGRSYAADLGLDYRDEFKINDRTEYKLNIGLDIMNMGSKISYTDSRDKNFIPTTMNFGLMNSFRVQITPLSVVMINIGYQTDKLLIPTPSANSRQQHPLKAMFTSFSDAPGGATEELQEFIHHLGGGAEYIWKDKIMAGFNNGVTLQHENKGSKYYLVGFYFGAYWFHCDFSYRHPLKYGYKNYQLTLGFNLHFKSSLKAKFYN